VNNTPNALYQAIRNALPSSQAFALALAVSAVAPLSQAAQADAALHIQAQPLASALSQLGQQTSLQVFFSPQLVAGKQAPAVDGNLSPEEALNVLLRGSGLDYDLKDGSVTLRAGARPRPARWSWHRWTSRWWATGSAMPTRPLCRTTRARGP